MCVKINVDENEQIKHIRLAVKQSVITERVRWRGEAEGRERGRCKYRRKRAGGK